MNVLIRGSKYGAGFPPQPKGRLPYLGECSTGLEGTLSVRESPQITRHGSHLTLQCFNTPVHPDRREHAAGKGHAHNLPTEEEVSDRKTGTEDSAQEYTNAEQAAKRIAKRETKVQCGLVSRLIKRQYVEHAQEGDGT